MRSYGAGAVLKCVGAVLREGAVLKTGAVVVRVRVRFGCGLFFSHFGV